MLCAVVRFPQLCAIVIEQSTSAFDTLVLLLGRLTVAATQSPHCLTGMKFGELVEITEENGDW